MKNPSSYFLVFFTVMLIIGFVFNGILSCLNNTQKNTFQVQTFFIPSNDIVHVGLRKDDIFAIDNPVLVSASQSSFKDHELIIGINEENQVKDYRVSLLMKPQEAKTQDQESSFVNNIQVTFLEIRRNWKNEVWEPFDVWENSLNLIVTDWFPWYVSLLETENYKLSC